MQPEVKHREEQRILYVRKHGPYHESAQAAWKELMAICGPIGLLNDASQCLGVSHDDPAVVPAEKLRYDACVVSDAALVEGLEEATLPAGRFAIFVHTGPYENMGETLKPAYARWVPEANLVLAAGPCLEVYLNDPRTTAPAELKTEIWIPVE